MGRPAKDSESLVCEEETDELDPEYRGTRETPWEAGGTTLQA